MSYQVAFGTDTESIEDPSQLVLLTMPDTCADLDADELAEYINLYYGSADVSVEPLVGLNDVIDAVLLAMHAEGFGADTKARIIATLCDAIDNNS